MPITGVYFIPSNPNSSTALPQITDRLRTTFPDEELTPIGRWALEQKLLRDTPGLISSSKTQTPRYMQFLSLTHHPHHGFIYTSEPEPSQSQSQSPAPAQTGPVNAIAPDHSPALPMIMTTVPPAASATLFQHFTYACQPSWSHRLTVAVNGVVYDVGDFRVRMGDVRQTFPTARVRGTVVEIEWRGPSVVDAVGLDGMGIREEDVDAEYVATAGLIREFWGRLGVVGREAILIPGVGSEVKARLGKAKAKVDVGLGREDVRVDENLDASAGTDVARQFMEVLRFNR